MDQGFRKKATQTPPSKGLHPLWHGLRNAGQLTKLAKDSFLLLHLIGLVVLLLHVHIMEEIIKVYCRDKEKSARV